ncbi:MAG: serine hydrolase [Bacteroidetes bacterium]|nr:serine hydrolase [Bacteroidota bacterium]
MNAAILLMIATGLVVYFFFPRLPKVVMTDSKKSDCPEKMDELRLKDYKLTQPLLFVDIPNENSELISIKNEINEMILRDKSSNLVRDVSVYYRRLNDGAWFLINGAKTYTPASLMKVAFLISILKQSETDPGLLNKKIYFDKHFQNDYHQNIKNFGLEQKRNYSVKELLSDMIVHSDNDALILISQLTDQKVFSKIFTDLGVASPPMDPTKGADYVIAVNDFCKLFRILYNSGYLTDAHSEFALELLSASTYKDGLLKNLEPAFPVSHKFGERVSGNTAQLHEIGIFYSESEPYLLGVMSEGRDLKNLSTVLSQVSEIVYRNHRKGN